MIIIFAQRTIVMFRYGNFYSICHRQYSKAGNLVEKYRIMKLNGSIDKYGYVTYRITIDGIKKHLKAHRMMLNAWIGERQNLVVNHNRIMPSQISNGVQLLKIMLMRLVWDCLIRMPPNMN